MTRESNTRVPQTSRLAGFLRQPFAHFVAGAALIFVFDAVQTRLGSADVSRITVSDVDTSKMTLEWERKFARPPTPAELDTLVAAWVEEEVYYRQAVALGLDAGDPVLRRYLANKMRFLTEDAIVVPETDEAELIAFYEENAGDFAAEPKITFSEVRLNPADADAVESVRKRLNAEIDGGAAASRPTSRMSEAGRMEVSRKYGVTFYEQLLELPAEGWQGPVASAQGMHLVRVDSREDARPPEFETVREGVSEAWASARRAQLERAAYQQLLDSYTVEITGADQ